MMEERGRLKRALVDTAAGAIAGGISRTVTSPLDVIKIRFQVQLEPTSTWALVRNDAYQTSKYTGILRASKDIFREEGLPGFWREDHLHLSPYLSYISGALAGCAATIGSYPFDLLRTVLASQGVPDYETWNHYRASQNGIPGADDALPSIQLFLCGLAAGTCAKLVCHPLDVVKKRFQIEGLKRHPRYGARVEPHAYKNMFDAVQQILRSEGWAGLYKGIVPSTVKAAPAGAVTFVAYEYVSDWLELTMH